MEPQIIYFAQLHAYIPVNEEANNKSVKPCFAKKESFLLMTY